MALEYDPAGRLFREQGAADTRFLYDGLDALSEYDASGTRLRRYVHGPGVDEPLVWYEGPTTSDRRWLLADERGSVIAWTTPAGATGAIDTYDDWGVPGAANVGRFQYTGQMLLPEIGVYHYKARAYHPVLGRFLQPDPIGYGDGLNLYAYVRNDPVNLIDPLGLALICPTPTTCYTVRDGSGSDEVEELVVTGTRIEQVEFVTTDWNLFDFSTRGIQQIDLSTRGERGDAPQSDKTCASPHSVGSARAVLEAAALGADIATVGLAAGGVTGPAAIGTKALGLAFELGLGAVNAYDAYANGNYGPLEAQGASLGARLIPGGRAFQGGLKAVRGPTGLLRNSSGRFRSSYLNNPAVGEIGQQATQRGAGAAVGAVVCPNG